MNKIYYICLTPNKYSIMKNLKKISRNELKSVVGGIGTNDGLPFCTKPRQIELWEMQCSPLDTEPCYAAGCRMK